MTKGEQCWHVVDAKRGGRSWDKLYQQLTRVIDDLYQCCELEGRSDRARQAVHLLQDAVHDFNDLSIQLATLSKAGTGTPVAWRLRPPRQGSRSPVSPPPDMKTCQACSEHHTPTQTSSNLVHSSNAHAKQDASAQPTNSNVAVVMQSNSTRETTDGKPGFVSKSITPTASGQKQPATGIGTSSKQPIEAPTAKFQPSSSQAIAQANGQQLLQLLKSKCSATSSGSQDSKAGCHARQQPSVEVPLHTSTVSTNTSSQSVKLASSCPETSMIPTPFATVKQAGDSSSSPADCNVLTTTSLNIGSQRSLNTLVEPNSWRQIVTNGSANKGEKPTGTAGLLVGRKSSSNNSPNSGPEGIGMRRLSGEGPRELDMVMPLKERGSAVIIDSSLVVPKALAGSKRNNRQRRAGNYAAIAPADVVTSQPQPNNVSGCANQNQTVIKSDASSSNEQQRQHVTADAIVAASHRPGKFDDGQFLLARLQVAIDTDREPPSGTRSSPGSPPSSLLSPRRRTAQETKRSSEEKQARAESARRAAEEARRAKLVRAQESRLGAMQHREAMSEAEAEAVLSKLSEKDARSRQLRQAHLAAVVQRAGDEGRKVAEVAFINQLQEENKKLSLQQKLEDGEARRREFLEEKLAKGKEAAAAAESAAERRKAAEDARQAELVEKARKKEAAQAAWAAKLEEQRRALAAARENAKEAQKRIASAMALAAQKEAAAHAQRIEARLAEAAQRRMARLETIRERAALGAVTSSGGDMPSFPTQAPSSPARTVSFIPRGSMGGDKVPGSPSLLSPTNESRARRQLSLDGIACSSEQQLKTAGGHVTGAVNAKNRLKGLRRRAAKLLAQISSESCFLELPTELKAHTSTPSGAALLQKLTALVNACQQTTTTNHLPCLAKQLEPETANNYKTVTVKEEEAHLTDKEDNSGLPQLQPAQATETAAETVKDNEKSIRTETGCVATVGNEESAEEVAEVSEHSQTSANKQTSHTQSSSGSETGNTSVESCTSPTTLSNESPNVPSKSLPVSLHVVISSAAASLTQPQQKMSCLAAASTSNLLYFLCHVVGERGGCRLPAWDPAPTAAQLLLDLLQEPHNVCALLMSGQGVGLVKGVMRALDRVNGSESAADTDDSHAGELACLACSLQVLALIAQPVSQATHGAHAAVNSPHFSKLVGMRELLVGYMVANGLIHRLSELFYLCDQPMLWRTCDEATALTTSATDMSASTNPLPAQQAGRNAMTASESCDSGAALALKAAENGWASPIKGALHVAISPRGPLSPRPTPSSRFTMNPSPRRATSPGVMHMRGISRSTSSALIPASLPPIPQHVVQGLHLLEAMTARPLPVITHTQQDSTAGGHACSGASGCQPQPFIDALPALKTNKQWRPLSANAESISLAFQETTMAGLPMLLTAVLLHAAPSCTPAEARPEALPPNFAEAALEVVRILNNVARLDLVALQSGLASSSHSVGVTHLLGFLISYSTNEWPNQLTPDILETAFQLVQRTGPWTTTTQTGQSPLDNHSVKPNNNQDSNNHSSPAGSPAGQQQPTQESKASSSGTGTVNCQQAIDRTNSPEQQEESKCSSSTVALLNEVLLLLGYFCLLDAGNQAMLTWGGTMSHLWNRVQSVPDQYVRHPILSQVLMPTLASVSLNNPRLCSLIENWIPLKSLIDSLTIQVDQHSITACKPAQQSQASDSDSNNNSCTCGKTSGVTNGTAVCECQHQRQARNNDCNQQGEQPTQATLAKVLQDPQLTVQQLTEQHVGTEHCQQTRTLQHHDKDAVPETKSLDKTTSSLPALPFRYSLHQRMPKPLILKAISFFEKSMSSL